MIELWNSLSAIEQFLLGISIINFVVLIVLEFKISNLETDIFLFKREMRK